jgi:signal transduction histidine kinase
VWALRPHVRGARGDWTPPAVAAGAVPVIACGLFLVPRFAYGPVEPALLTLSSVALLASPTSSAWSRFVIRSSADDTGGTSRRDGHEAIALFTVAAPLAVALSASATLDATARVALLGSTLAISIVLAVFVLVRGRQLAREVGTFTEYVGRIEVHPDSVVRPTSPSLQDPLLRSLERQVVEKSDGLERAAQHDAKARTQIADARELRTRFMAAMSHELRSPLNSIVGFAQILERGLEGELTEGQHESVTMVRRSAEELILLLTDVLDLARLEAGKLTLRREWTPSVEILTEAVSRGRSIVEGRDVEIEAELQPGLPPVYADRRRIVQAVVALFRHAAGSLRKTTIRLRTRIALGPPGPDRHLRVEIHDALGAIPREEVERIFEAFQEISAPTGRRVGGLGMALSLSRGLVRAHGGDVWAESFPGAGTILCIALPLEPPAED